MKKGWEYKKLGEVATFRRGLTYSKKDECNHSTNIVLRSNNIDLDSGKLCFDKLKYLKEDFYIPNDKKVRRGCLLMCMSNGSKAHLGKVALIDKDYGYAFGGFMSMVVPSSIIFGDYLFYNLGTPQYKAFIKSLSAGANINNIKVRDLEKFSIPVPPLSEQQRIVSYLDSAFAKIDAVAKNAEDSLNDAKALFQSALTKMMEPKEGWSKKNFGDICTFVRGPFGGSLKKDCFKESGYAVYEQQNAIYNRFSFRYFIDEEKYNSMSRFKVEPGDLIMSCSGTIGKVAIVPKDAKRGIINQALLKLTPSTKIDAEFLKYLMESNFFKGILSLNAGGAAINNIASVSTLKKIELSIPTVEEQREIVKKLNSIKKVFLNISSNLTLTLSECAALKQSILRQTFE